MDEKHTRLRNIISTLLALIGTVLLAASTIGADLMYGSPGFGIQQIIGSGIGLIMIYAAWAIIPPKKRQRGEAS
jgi:hypothetical protein